MTNDVGQWIYQHGFTLRDTGRKVSGFPPWHRRTVYEYTADPRCPMTLHVAGEYIRPDKHGETDMGSVPELAQIVVPKDLHLPSFILHDSACREHGLYYADTFHGKYEFRSVTSGEAARLLGIGLCAAGYQARAAIVVAAVRMCGPRF